ncbi:DUF2868 domain-containing protein [Gilliamella sp. ESL0441]|uniref:DUF2868 domain-containing protein n=1 Tax=Gilliamella sp. ESL0441 TaxID=2704654 RepID=UPI001C6A0E8E|nr:DUF2868 domain-containing protein [Gilliamella sp. ESL0441]QYN44137.1 DUF2868 domain-containing protein [Gilliamella sp. ESL0441]
MREELKSLWLTETIRLIENESGRFADQDINRQIRAKQNTSLTQRIVLRALALSKLNGLYSAQKLLLHTLKISFVLLLILSAFLGGSLAFGALSQNPVNLYWALFSLLGVHFITLSIWICSFFFFSQFGGSVLIHCWIWLAKKLSQKKTIQELIPAFVQLFGNNIRWFVGFVLNLYWTIILSFALLVLLILFSTQHYSFEWKSTLLSPNEIIQLTHYLGFIPSMFGFSIPKDDVIRFSEQALSDSEVRSSWAMWLLGVFIVYGLFIRILCMVICGINWKIRSRQIRLNLDSPEYQILANDLQPISIEIIDEDRYGIRHHSYQTENAIDSSNGEFLVAIDISEDWIPPDSVYFLGFLNSREQRRKILDYLQLKPAQKLLIAIDTDRAPDRGVLNLLNQLIEKSQQSRIWFINQGKQLTNWQSLPYEFAGLSWLKKEQ